MSRNADQTAREKAIFDAFLTAYPSFASTVAYHSPPDDRFPDRIVKLRDGSKIEFELAEWIHEGQTAHSKQREQLAETIIHAIGEQRENRSQYFCNVLIFPKQYFPRWSRADEKAMHEEVWALVEDTERRWPTECFWHSPTGRHVGRAGDFDLYPTIGKYIAQVNFYPLAVAGRQKEKIPDVPWIDVSAPGGSYSSKTAIDALKKILHDKISGYGGLDRPLRLLVYYGTAVRYNTPIYDIKFRQFSDVAEEATRIVAGQSSFEKIFLFKALLPNLEAFEIYPTSMKCR